MEPAVITIVAGIIVTVVGGIFLQWWNKRIKAKEAEKKKELAEREAMKEELEDIKKEIWKLRKTTLIIAKILDDQTNKNHPELITNLEDIATEMLKQSDKS